MRLSKKRRVVLERMATMPPRAIRTLPKGRQKRFRRRPDRAFSDPESEAWLAALFRVRTCIEVLIEHAHYRTNRRENRGDPDFRAVPQTQPPLPRVPAFVYPREFATFRRP